MNEAITLYNSSLDYLGIGGHPIDEPRAFKLNAQAAALGYRDAILAMGWFYVGGRGVERGSCSGLTTSSSATAESARHLHGGWKGGGGSRCRDARSRSLQRMVRRCGCYHFLGFGSLIIRRHDITRFTSEIVPLHMPMCP